MFETSAPPVVFACGQGYGNQLLVCMNLAMAKGDTKEQAYKAATGWLKKTTGVDLGPIPEAGRGLKAA